MRNAKLFMRPNMKWINNTYRKGKNTRERNDRLECDLLDFVLKRNVGIAYYVFGMSECVMKRTRISYLGRIKNICSTNINQNARNGKDVRNRMFNTFNQNNLCVFA